MTEGAKEKPLISTDVEGSIFGHKGSWQLLEELQKQNPKDPLSVLRQFLRKEANARDEGEPQKDWQDALNVTIAAYWSLEKILSEEEIELTGDIKLIQKSLKESAEKNETNQKERETLARIYLSLRRKLFPELPESADQEF